MMYFRDPTESEASQALPFSILISLARSLHLLTCTDAGVGGGHSDKGAGTFSLNKVETKPSKEHIGKIILEASLGQRKQYWYRKRSDCLQKKRQIFH
jgi:hypothetical protein